MSDATFFPPHSPPDGVMALVFTDLEGSSALSLTHGRAFETLRERHFAILRAACEHHGGWEVETAGDSLFAVFQSPLQAASWALQARAALEIENWPQEIGALKVRFGIHVGEPFISRDPKTGAFTFRGPATNRAARVMSAANGNQILLSQSAFEALSPLDSAFQSRDLGAHRLKGIGCETLHQLDFAGEKRDFGPLQTLLVKRHNLPLPPTPFIGREEEIEPLRGLLLAPPNRLLTLWAFGGMGKTRLALHLAETLTDDFADGVWWAALESARSEDAMLAAIAGALPLETDPTRPPLEQIAAFLDGKNLLLVLDNAEQIEAAPLVVSQLLARASGFKILVTSRHALQIRAEIAREVEPLSPLEAARFFAERTSVLGAPIEESDPLLPQIAARVEGVPLALELAASLARVLGTRQILERLGDQLQLLRSRLPDLPPRQRALRATMDWSFEMLAPGERELLQQLSIFAGGFDWEDIEAIGADSDALFDLEELLRRSLVRSGAHPVREGEKRYSMLESIRSYALAKRLENGESSELSRAHARHFERKFETWSGCLRTRRETLALCEAELDFDNARAALRFWNALGQPQNGAQLALDFGRILTRTGRLREAGERLQSGLESVEESFTGQQLSLRANLLLERAGTFFDLADGENAERLAREAQAIFEKIGEDEKVAGALNLRGLIALRIHKNREIAREFLESAHALSGGTLAAIVASNLGLVAFEERDLERALAYFQSARPVYEREGYERGLAETLTNLGVLAQEQNDLETAQGHYRAALELERKMRGQIGIARALSNLGEVAVLRGDFAGAAPILAASVVLFERADSPIASYTRGWLQKACALSQQNVEELLARMRSWRLEELGNCAKFVRLLNP